MTGDAEGRASPGTKARLAKYEFPELKVVRGPSHSRSSCFRLRASPTAESRPIAHLCSYVFLFLLFFSSIPTVTTLLRGLPHFPRVQTLIQKIELITYHVFLSTFISILDPRVWQISSRDTRKIFQWQRSLVFSLRVKVSLHLLQIKRECIFLIIWKHDSCYKWYTLKFAYKI